MRAAENLGRFTGTRSPEDNANLHTKKRDLRDLPNVPDTELKQRGQSKQEWTFGYEAHLALMTGTPGCESFPRFVLGVSLDRPGLQPGMNAVAAVNGIVKAGLPVGIMTTDLGYSQQLPENYALPVKALGYSLMHMFKTNAKTKADERFTLGIQDTFQGVLWFPPNRGGLLYAASRSGATVFS